MKDKLLNRLSQHQDELMGILNKCPEFGDREDLLQDWYLFIYEKNFPSFSMGNMFKNNKLNGGFVYITMRNFTLDKIRKVATHDEKIQESYRAYFQATELEEDSLADNLVHEYNSKTLKDLFKGVSKKDYKDILKLQSRELSADFVNSKGELDKNAYKKRWRYLHKILDSVKLDAKKNYKYLTIENISELSTYDDLNSLNIKNKI